MDYMQLLDKNYQWVVDTAEYVYTQSRIPFRDRLEKQQLSSCCQDCGFDGELTWYVLLWSYGAVTAELHHESCRPVAVDSGQAIIVFVHPDSKDDTWLEQYLTPTVKNRYVDWCQKVKCGTGYVYFSDYDHKLYDMFKSAYLVSMLEPEFRLECSAYVLTTLVEIIQDLAKGNRL